MKIEPEHTDQTIATEIGRRITQIRLSQNLTHAVLADRCGVSISAINRIEHGKITQFSTFLRICRGLNLLTGFDALLPVPEISPILQLKLQGKQRKRASTSTTPPSQPKTPWKWGNQQ